MYIHNLNPVLFDFGFLIITWYSLSYIFGILIGWWLAKKIISNKFLDINFKFKVEEFDDLVTYLIFSIILGGRIGYIIFYNFGYYLSNPLDILKIWEGGMSFHGALIGVIISTYYFALKKKNTSFFPIRYYCMRSSYWNIFWTISKFYKR